MESLQKYDKSVHFGNAKRLIDSGDYQSLKFACLELRFMIEAHVYERLLHEIDDLPKSVIQTWQPNKAIRLLSQFDDLADKDLHLQFLDQDDEIIDHVKYNNIPIKDLNKIYNSLGSYLHLPTPKKISNYTIDKDKIFGFLEKLERLTNGNLIIYKIQYDSFKCQACGKDVVYTRQYIENNESIVCQNDNCKIEYQIKLESNTVSFGSEYVFNCGVCNNETSVYFSKIEDGYKFPCKSCDTMYTFEMILRGQEKSQAQS